MSHPRKQKQQQQPKQPNQQQRQTHRLEGAESLLLTPKASNKKPTLAFDSSSASIPNITTKKTKAQPITNTNSDKLCASKNFLSRKFYQLSLHNGLYMLNRNEQLALTAAGGIFTILALLYLSVFVRGFVDGMRVPPQQLQQQQQLQSPQQTQQLSDSGNSLFAQLYHHHANGAGAEPTTSEPKATAAATTTTSSMGNAIAVEESGAPGDSATESSSSASSSSSEKTTTTAVPTSHDGSGNSHSPVQQGVAEAVVAKATAGSGIITEL